MSTPSHPAIWKRLHLPKLALYAALSIADLLMTRELLQAGDGNVYEGNPFAEAWQASFGLLGLSAYKAVAMLLATGCILYVSLHRPRLGGRLLVFACGATAAVVCYSCYLAHHIDPSTALTQDDAWSTRSRGQWLDQEMARQKSYEALLGQLSEDLIDRRCTLTEAVALLSESEKARDPRWLEVLHRTWPGRSDAECLAVHLGHHVVGKIGLDHSLAESVSQLLECDFSSAFGKPCRFSTAGPLPQADHENSPYPSRWSGSGGPPGIAGLWVP
jgi:hypothetical protein